MGLKENVVTNLVHLLLVSSQLSLTFHHFQITSLTVFLYCKSSLKRSGMAEILLLFTVSLPDLTFRLYSNVHT